MGKESVDRETVIQSFETLKEIMRELYVFGDYDPSGRRGPARWLACVEARVLAVDAKELRGPEDLPPELQPLAAMRFQRGG
jgi:hypothetical protein